MRAAPTAAGGIAEGKLQLETIRVGPVTAEELHDAPAVIFQIFATQLSGQMLEIITLRIAGDHLQLSLQPVAQAGHGRGLRIVMTIGEAFRDIEKRLHATAGLLAFSHEETQIKEVIREVGFGLDELADDLIDIPGGQKRARSSYRLNSRMSCGRRGGGSGRASTLVVG